jgi:thiamine monophosphate synthase
VAWKQKDNEMKTLIKKAISATIKSAILAAAFKGALSLAKKVKTRTNEEKVQNFVDEKADLAKEAAKKGVHATFNKLDELVDKADDMEAKGKVIKEDLSTKGKELKDDLMAKVTVING